MAARIFGEPIIKLAGASLDSLVNRYAASRESREREFAEAIGRGLSATSLPELLEAAPNADLFLAVYRAMLLDDDERKANVYGEAMRSVLMGLCPEPLRFHLVAAVRSAQYETLALLVSSWRTWEKTKAESEPGTQLQSLRWETMRPILGPFKEGDSSSTEELAERQSAVNELVRLGLVDQERSAARDVYGQAPPQHSAFGSLVVACIVEAFR